jgi:hypothetical protein
LGQFIKTGEKMIAAVVTINDESARGEKTNTLKLTLASERITVRDIIQRRIQQEVEKFNLQRPVVFKMLVQPADAEETTQGFRMQEHRNLDWQQQFDKAVEAFGEKCFFVMVDGKDMADLDTEVTVTDDTQISFIKLLPVIAG